MKYKPHDYQIQALAHIIQTSRCVLWLDMGLGKTVTTLTALTAFPNLRALIIAPKRVAEHTWPNEIKKWEHTQHLSFSLITGTEKQRTHALETNTPTHIISRDNLAWLTKQPHPTYDILVFDELSSYKNPTAKRTRAALKLSKTARRVIGLTGTPAPNGYLDLFAQYLVIDLGQRLGTSIVRYRNTYFRATKYVYQRPVGWTLTREGEATINGLIKDITLSMKADDYLTMPPITYTTTVARMSRTETARYEQFKKNLIIEIEGETIIASNAAVLSSKLSQYASGAIYAEDGTPVHVHAAKIDALADVIEATNGQPLLVAYWFKTDLEALTKGFPDGRVLETSKDFDEWNAGKVPLAFIHPASVGHGINLQAGGHYLAWYTTPWSLELYQQANARIYRQGQSRPVTITHIATEGTIDARVIRALETKRTTQDDLLSAVKAELYPERKN